MVFFFLYIVWTYRAKERERDRKREEREREKKRESLEWVFFGWNMFKNKSKYTKHLRTNVK